jgi:hypothetical protein
MDPQDFEVLMRKLDSLSSSLDRLAKNKPQQLSEKDITAAMSSALEADKDTDKMTGKEKKKIQKIAKIFKKEFEELSLTTNTIKKQDAKDKATPLLVTLDKKSFKGLEKTLKTVLPDFFEQLSKDTKKAADGKSGLFGSLAKGALGIVSLLNGLKTFALSVAAIGLLFYAIKNIEKISKGIDTIFKSGKENLPEIGETLKNLFLPFLRAAIEPLNNLINLLPTMVSIFLNYFPDIRKEITAFVNETDPKKLLEIGGAFLALYAAWKTIQTVKGVADAFTSPASAINNLNNILKSIDLVLLGTTLIAFAKSFETFSDTIAKYKDIDWETMTKAGISLVALFGSIKLASSSIGPAAAFKALIASIVGGAGLAVALRELAWGLEPWKDIPRDVAVTAGGAVAGLIASLGALTLIGSAGPLPALFGAAGLLAAEGTLILGLRGIAEMFKATMDTWEKLPDVFKKYETIDFAQISSVAGAITQLAGALALSSISGGVTTIADTFTGFWNKITGKESPYNIIIKYEQLDGDRLNRNAESIRNLFKAIGSGGGDDVKQAIENLNNLKFDKLGNLLAVPKPTQPGLPAKVQQDFISRPKLPAKVQQDFISRPNQPPIAFSSQDTVVAFKKTNIFDSIEGKIDTNYRKITEMIQKTFADQQKLTESSVLENRKHTELLGKLVSSNETMADQTGPGGAFFNSSVNNNIINVDSYTASTYRSRLGRSPGMPA